MPQLPKPQINEKFTNPNTRQNKADDIFCHLALRRLLTPVTMSSMLIHNSTSQQKPCDTYTKPPECVDIIPIHHEVFTAGALEARVRRTSAFRTPAGKTE